MPRNVEIKARLKDAAATTRLVERIATAGPIELRQVDTFFNAGRGRLKLREINDTGAELIWYDRPDLSAPKESRYTIAKVDEPERMLEVLGAALGVRVTVRKHRRLYLVGQTRVHLDEVEQLGVFLELEVVLAPEQSQQEGASIAEDLLGRLAVSRDDLVAVAYADLLSAASA